MLKCTDCRHWYGAEEDEYGPCTILHQQGADQYITYGGQDCIVDEVREAYEAGELEWAD